MELHKFKVEPVEGYPQGARLYLDDKEIRAVAFTLEHRSTEFAHLTLELDVETDIDYNEIDCETISVKQERLEHELKSNRELLRSVLQSLYDIENGSTYDVKKNVGYLKKYVENHMNLFDIVSDLKRGKKNEVD